MESILISKLKAHLSATIKEVIQGKEFIVFDRNNAVARLQPIQEESGLIIQSPKKKKKLNISHKIKSKKDPIDFLLKDREGNRF